MATAPHFVAQRLRVLATLALCAPVLAPTEGPRVVTIADARALSGKVPAPAPLAIHTKDEPGLGDYLDALRVALQRGDLDLWEDARAILLHGFDDDRGQLAALLDEGDAKISWCADGEATMDAEGWARYDGIESKVRKAYGLAPRLLAVAA